MTSRLEQQLLALHQVPTIPPNTLVFGVEKTCRKAFSTLKKLAGLTDIRFHDLRHTAATRMIQAGIPLQEVGRILGHTQANTTYRYVNANADTAKRVARALDVFLLEANNSNIDEERIN